MTRTEALQLKRKYYLIDTENVGDRWMDLPDKIDKKDRLIVFYTDHHSKIMEKCLLKQLHNPHIIWLECMEGNNALDYQLIGVLSYLITKHSQASFSIYSNDKDYHETVEYWKTRGIRIVQKFYEVSEKKKTKSKKKKGKQAKKQEKKQIGKTLKSSAGKIGDSDESADLEKKKAGRMTQIAEEQLMIEIARAVPVTQFNGWYTALTALLGQEKGRKQYQQFKKESQLRTKLSKYLEGDEHQRTIGLICLVLKQNGLDQDRAEDAYQIIMQHNFKNLNAVKAAFDVKFGTKPPQKYYAAMRPFIRLIKSEK